MELQVGHTIERAGTVRSLVLAAALLIVVFLAVFPDLWYGVHEISDVPVYQNYAQQMAGGLTPYRDFHVEYPPLAIPLFWLPWRLGAAHYATWFAVEMFGLTVIAAALACLVALRLWPGERSLMAVAMLFAAATAACGAIIENRYDVGVAVVVAALLLFLVEHRWVAAAVTIGVGFALKITPLALLPLVLILASAWTTRIRATIGCALAALAACLPPIIQSPGGLWYVLQYHLKRPLQIESVLATPYLVGKAIGRVAVAVDYSHASHAIAAGGTRVVASFSGPLTAAALTFVLWLAWRRRSFLLAAPRALPTALYTVLLALMIGSKVLSPQYFIWLLPVVAVVTIDDLTLGALGFATLLATQIEFPFFYGRLITLQPSALWVVSARNLLLVATFAAAVRRLATMPAAGSGEGEEEGSVRSGATAI